MWGCFGRPGLLLVSCGPPSKPRPVPRAWGAWTPVSLPCRDPGEPEVLMFPGRVAALHLQCILHAADSLVISLKSGFPSSHAGAAGA